MLIESSRADNLKHLNMMNSMANLLIQEKNDQVSVINYFEMPLTDCDDVIVHEDRRVSAYA